MDKMREAQCAVELVVFRCRWRMWTSVFLLPPSTMAPCKTHPTLKGTNNKSTQSKTAKEHVKVNLDALRILKAAHYRAENTRKLRVCLTHCTLLAGGLLWLEWLLTFGLGFNPQAYKMFLNMSCKPTWTTCWGGLVRVLKLWKRTEWKRGEKELKK